jgi:hypothetical protein
MVRAILVVAAFVCAACNVEVGIDRATWACVRDSDCGSAARCVAGACVPEPTGRVCTTRTRAGVSMRFEVTADRELAVTVGGRTKPFRLPPNVVGIEDGAADPVAGCCENACCAERP